LESGGQLRPLGEVELDEHELLGRLLDEGRLAEDLGVELDAPAAPVGAREVHQDIFLFLGGALERPGDVGRPDVARGLRGRAKAGEVPQKHHGRRQHRESVVTHRISFSGWKRVTKTMRSRLSFPIV